MPLILPNTIANGLPADGDKLDQNFDTITDWANQEAISRDGSTAMQAPLLLPGNPTQPNQAATKAYVDSAGPIGAMTMYIGQTEPANWMFCRGQAISRATYATLFSIVGTAYGSGDGTTTFNLPSFMGRMPLGHWPGGSWGASFGQMGGNADSTLPSHDHSVDIWSGGEDADHSHYVPAANTSQQGNNHNHYANWGEIFRHSGDPVDNVNTFAFRVGDGYTVVMSKVNTYTTPTGDNNQGHLHASSAVQTHGRSNGHRHAVNGRAGAAGASASQTNIPPFTVVNYIVKVL